MAENPHSTRGRRGGVRHRDAGGRAVFHMPALPARKGLQGLRSRMSRTFPPNLARLMLLCCAALWGGSYLMAKRAMTQIPPQWLMAVRMIGACLIMLALFHRSILHAMSRRIIVPALIVGVTYYGTMCLQMIGLKTIDPGRSAFLSAVYCVLVPFATWMILGRRPGMLNVVAGVICMMGVGFVALRTGTGSMALSSGDMLTLLCGVVCSVNLVYLGHYARSINPIALTFVQFAVAGVLFVISALLTEPMPNASWGTPVVIWSLLYLVVGATTAAQIMQNIGLAHVPASSAAIIMCTESLFSVSFSVLAGVETLGWNALVGFALIFTAVVLSVIARRAASRRIVPTSSQ